MKFLGLITGLLLSYTFAYGQTWFDLGVKGGVGGSFLLNKTIADDARLDIAPSMNHFFGGNVGVNFGEMNAIKIEFNYGTYNLAYLQSSIPGGDPNKTFRYNLGFNTLSIMPLYRFTKEASYLELGPEFAFIRNPFIDDKYSGTSSSLNPDEVINSKTTSLIFGFGGHMVGNEVISLMMGLRFKYQLSDLTGYSYSETNYPFNNYSDITTSNKTNAFSAQVVLELNYSLGYFVTASCGRRTAFLTF